MVASRVNLRSPVNRRHRLTHRQLAWWLALPGLDGGRWWYDVLGGHHGALTGMSAASGWRPTTRPGGFGCLQFGDAAAAVVVPDADALDVTDNYTLTMWVRTSLVATQKLWTKGGGGLEIDIANGTSLRMNRDNSTVLLQTPFSASGVWQFLAARKQGPDLTLVIDRGFTVGTNATALSATARELAIGAEDAAGSTPLSGQLDDVRLWARPLSDAEIGEVRDNARLGCPGLLSRDRFLPEGPQGPVFVAGLGRTFDGPAGGVFGGSGGFTFEGDKGSIFRGEP